MNFSFSRASNDLKTLCNTPLYLVLKVYNKKDYMSVMNIWSLNVIVLKFVYSLLNHHEYAKRWWCKRLIEKVNDWDSENLIDFLLTAMLVIELKFWHSVKTWLNSALKLSVSFSGCSLTSMSAFYAEEYEASVFSNKDLAANFIWQSFQSEDSILLFMIWRYVRSNTSSFDSFMFEKSESVSDLFKNGWLQDLNCVKSSVTAIEENLSD